MKRAYRPKSLILMSGILILVPGVYLYVQSLNKIELPFLQIPLAADTTLLLLMILQGLLVLIRHRVCYFLGIGISIYILSASLQSFFSSKTIFQLSNVSITFFQVIFLVYLTSTEIYFPYFSNKRRGWRNRKRRSIETKASIAGQLFKIKDISEKGLFINCDPKNFTLDQIINVKLLVSDGAMLLEMKVVRIENEGISAEFINLNWKATQALRGVLQREQTLYG